MANKVSNNLIHLLLKKEIDFDVDVFKMILMNSAFIFDSDAHEEYADVSASELGTAFGYTAGGVVLGGVAVTRDDASDRTDVTWTNPSWAASGGVIGPSNGGIVYDDTHANNVIVGYIDFGAPYTQADGGSLVINGVIFRAKNG